MKYIIKINRTYSFNFINRTCSFNFEGATREFKVTHVACICSSHWISTGCCHATEKGRR